MNLDRRAFTLGLLTATSAAAITGTAVAQPAPAGTIPAMQYLAMASRGGMFLEETGRIGFEKASNPNLRRFSRAEVVEQVTLSDKLAANGGQMAMAPAAPAGGFLGAAVAAPFAVAGAAVGVAGGVVGGVLGVPPGQMSTDAQKAQIIARLQAMPAGPEFDAMFVQVQALGHDEAFAIHGGYAEAGDDPALRRVARNALPLIRLHRSQLARMGAGRGMAQG